MPYGCSTKLIRSDIIIREIRKKTISDFTCVSCMFYSLPQKVGGRTRKGLGKAHKKPRRTSVVMLLSPEENAMEASKEEV